MWQETPTADKTESKPTQAPEASCHRYITPKNQLNEEKPDFLDFPPKLVAEQLTYMDAELFKTVLPQQCLGSIWTKRNKPGNKHLAPTVQATIAQFNGVANCVITTCLGNPSMTARDRAMVVEHWIKVAKGVIPYLGTFLTDLVMLDTAMEDYLEVAQEYKVMREIMLLQVAAENYNIEPKDPFRAWFQFTEWLSEDESYILSCQLEPRS
ncbi:hypothetical protein GH733_009955 [Mirounga leonina]|nr:hypothetical protein GH733_009955 [Mirounga leonina]